MKTITALLASVTLASVIQAATIQINYYTDGGCSDYLSSPPNVPTDGSCYNWSYGGDNSANIANCNTAACYCTFYTDSNCQGLEEVTTAPDGSNCASNWGHGFESFRCYI